MFILLPVEGVSELLKQLLELGSLSQSILLRSFDFILYSEWPSPFYFSPTSTQRTSPAGLNCARQINTDFRRFELDHFYRKSFSSLSTIPS